MEHTATCTPRDQCFSLGPLLVPRVSCSLLSRKTSCNSRCHWVMVNSSVVPFELFGRPTFRFTSKFRRYRARLRQRTRRGDGRRFHHAAFRRVSSNRSRHDLRWLNGDLRLSSSDDSHVESPQFSFREHQVRTELLRGTCSSPPSCFLRCCSG